MARTKTPSPALPVPQDDAAARAAKQAFADWRDMGGAERKRILHAIADAIVARSDEIAALECMDTGQAWRFMSKAALRGAENFRFFACEFQAVTVAAHPLWSLFERSFPKSAKAEHKKSGRRSLRQAV